jgi:hypothetical protein
MDIVRLIGAGTGLLMAVFGDEHIKTRGWIMFFGWLILFYVAD